MTPLESCLQSVEAKLQADCQDAAYYRNEIPKLLKIVSTYQRLVAEKDSGLAYAESCLVEVTSKLLRMQMQLSNELNSNAQIIGHKINLKLEIEAPHDN